jgi:hypothetical protein
MEKGRVVKTTRPFSLLTAGSLDETRWNPWAIALDFALLHPGYRSDAALAFGNPCDGMLYR